MTDALEQQTAIYPANDSLIKTVPIFPSLRLRYPSVRYVYIELVLCRKSTVRSRQLTHALALHSIYHESCEPKIPVA